VTNAFEFPSDERFLLLPAMILLPPDDLQQKEP